MQSLLQALSSEILKIKRTPALWLVIVIPVFMTYIYSIWFPVASDINPFLAKMSESQWDVFLR